MSVYDWAEAQDPEWAHAVRWLCAETVLAAGPDAPNGVTLVWPDESARREFCRLAAEDDDAARAALLAHVLNRPAASAAAFTEAPIGALGGWRVAARASGRGVIIAGTGGDSHEATLERAADFHAARREGAAVWCIVAGAMPIAGEALAPVASSSRRRRARGAKTAAPAEPPVVNDTADARRALAAATETAFETAARAGKLGVYDPYLSYVVGFLWWVREHRPEVWAELKPVLDYDPAVTFYLLFEPYRLTPGSRAVPDDVFAEWAGPAAAQIPLGVQKSGREDYLTLLAEAAGAPDGGDDHPDRVEPMRHSIAKEKPRRIGTAVAAIYDKETPRGGPVSAARRYWRDLFRFIFAERFARIRLERRFERQDFEEIVQDLQTIWCGDNTADPVFGALDSDVAPSTSYQLALKFVNSSDFLYTPWAPAIAEEEQGPDLSNLRSTEPWNRNKLSYDCLKKFSDVVVRRT